MSKGLFSSDFLAALAIFIVILLIVGPFWASLNGQRESLEATRRLQNAAMLSSELLLRTSGQPENWNSTYVTSIGLAGSSQRILNVSKAKYFFEYMGANYYEGKYKLGAGAYQMAVEMRGGDGAVIKHEGVDFTSGSVWPNATDVANVQRLALLEHNSTSRELVDLIVILWR